MIFAFFTIRPAALINLPSWNHPLKFVSLFNCEIMQSKFAILLAFLAVEITATPIVDGRAVAQLDQAAFVEAQQRDDSATRAFSNIQITVNDILVTIHRHG